LTEGKELKTDGTDDTLLDSTHINAVLFTVSEEVNLAGTDVPGRAKSLHKGY